MKFSVVIPVYNAAQTIERCLKSILGNSGPELEIIAVDDCSRDESLSLCEKLAKQYPNIRLLHNEKNCGVSYTRNRGLEAVTGEYTFFVDSDDWVEADYYSTFASALDPDRKCLPICGFVNHDERFNNRTDIYTWSKEEAARVGFGDALQILYQKTLLQQLWNKAFLTSVIKENGIRFDESISIGEDFRFILDYLKAGEMKELCFIERPLYHYMRDQSGSLMYNVGYEGINEPLRNLRKLYTIQGMEEGIIEERLIKDRKRMENLYAYLIMHNVQMAMSEKKKLIMKLNTETGKQLYYHNLKVLCKEKIKQQYLRFFGNGG